MQIKRAVVLVAVGLSTLFAAACGGTLQPNRAGQVSKPPTKAAVNLPTKDQLADDYAKASTAFNDVWRRSRPVIESGTTLSKGKGIGSDMATANWTQIQDFRAM